MKKKLLILIFSILIIASGIIIYAASVKIEYNYNVKVETPVFSIVDGKINVSITNQGKNSYSIDNDNSFVDILEKNDTSYTITKKQKISEVTGLDSSKTYKIFANSLTYKKDSETFTVTYHNEYVSSREDLKKLIILSIIIISLIILKILII